MIKNENTPRVLFYTDIPRIFRTILIGYLYEISQIYSVVLLSEKLDSKTERILSDKKVFPNIEKIVSVQQFSEKKENVFIHNKKLCSLAKEIIAKYKPDIVVAHGNYPFEAYLRRFTKKSGAISISFLGTLTKDTPDIITWRNLMGAYLRIPIFFPSQIKTLFVRGRKLLGQIFYFWILPLFSGQPPFIREPSFLYSRDHLRYQKGADYYFVFSKQDYDVCKKAGFLEEKLVTVEHPLKSKSRNFLKEKYFYNNDLIKQKANLKILTIMWPEIEIGFKKDNLNLITKEEIREKRLEIVRKIIKVFDGWKFFIKPHPVVKESFGKFQELIETFKSISSQIKVTDPLEPAEEYIEISDVILGMPPVSMTLFTASLQCPEKPIISLDLNKELLGDFYKDSDTIEYIDEEEKFIETIKLIKNGQYKKNKTNQKFEENKGIINILNNILKLKH